MAERTLKIGSFHIAVEEGALVGNLEETKTAVQAARAKLAQVVQWGTGRSMAGNFELCMKTYFFATPAGMGRPAYANAVRDVMAKLAALNTDFQSEDLTLKPVEVTAQTMDAAAYVHRSVPDALRDLTFGANPTRPASFYGPLHVRFDQMFPVAKAAGNLIHEATHRYIGTRDWAYLTNFDMIAYEAAFIAMGVPIPALPASVNAIKAWYGMTPQEAMNNADSYAGFVMMLDCT